MIDQRATGSNGAENAWLRHLASVYPTAVVASVGSVLSFAGRWWKWFPPSSFGDTATWTAATATVSVVALTLRQMTQSEKNHSAQMELLQDQLRHERFLRIEPYLRKLHSRVASMLGLLTTWDDQIAAARTEQNRLTQIWRQSNPSRSEEENAWGIDQQYRADLQQRTAAAEEIDAWPDCAVSLSCGSVFRSFQRHRQC